VLSLVIQRERLGRDIETLAFNAKVSGMGKRLTVYPDSLSVAGISD
jgi:hypothetical protein